jgi:hypothetical protein
MLRKSLALGVCLTGMSVALTAQGLFLSAPAGTGVSAGVNTATYNLGTGTSVSFMATLGGTEVSGTFSGSGTINYTAATNTIPITVTLPSGTLTGSILFYQGTFSDSAGNVVNVSTVHQFNTTITITGGTGIYVGATGSFNPGQTDFITVTCASGGTVGQACPGSFGTVLSIGGTGSFSVPAPVTPTPTPSTTPIPGTLILAACGIAMVAWIYRRNLIAR